MCYACVEEGEFKLAQLCGLNIIINADDLMEVRCARCAAPAVPAGGCSRLPQGVEGGLTARDVRCKWRAGC